MNTNNMHLKRTNFHQRGTRKSVTGGYTLVEMIMVVGIGSFVIVGMLSFFIQFYRMSFVNEQRNRINRDIRQLTGDLTRAGRQANYFTLYTSVNAADRDAPIDRRLDGSAGDLLVFVYKEDDTTDTIIRIECFFREATSGDVDELGAVKNYVVDIPAGSSASVESLIPSVSVLATASEVVELSKGLSNGRLFFNFWGKSIMVNGQIFHGNDAKRVTETYNFTISPRG
jgi:type II secretory pathway pseudopilin PulG